MSLTQNPSSPSPEALAWLLELSLALGEGLEPEAVAARYLQALTRGGRISAAAIWWRKGDAAALERLHALPAESFPTTLAGDGDLASPTPGPCRLIRADAADFALLPGPAGDDAQAALICRLQEQGLLLARVMDSSDFSPDLLAHMGRISEGLATGLSLRHEHARLRHAEDHLEELVAQRTAALLETTSKAERLARVKGEFLANMSHELRTPLNGVLGFAEIGIMFSKPDSKEINYFESIAKSGKVLLRSIDDILDFSKSETGQLKTESVPFVLLDVLTQSLESIKEQARAKSLGISVTKDPKLPVSCIGDPYRLGQVLEHLLANAVKFTLSGRIHLKARLEGETLVFAVHDTGIGMHLEQLQEIFEPFHQGDNSTTRKYGGAGLGLSICKRLVELMRGEIRVESTPGVGSVFEVRLPYLAVQAEPQPSQSPVSPALPGARLQGLEILVAEDNEDSRLLLGELLANEGAHPTLVEDGARAVAQVQARGAGAFDLVLMDVQMPVMNGIEATHHIHTIDPGLPVLGQTAHVLAEDREICLKAGMADQLTKPISIATLIQLASHLARRRV
jgi:signal transduction histidine kinase